MVYDEVMRFALNLIFGAMMAYQCVNSPKYNKAFGALASAFFGFAGVRCADPALWHETMRRWRATSLPI
jgi:hypothetical protein